MSLPEEIKAYIDEGIAGIKADVAEAVMAKIDEVIAQSVAEVLRPYIEQMGALKKNRTANENMCSLFSVFKQREVGQELVQRLIGKGILIKIDNEHFKIDAEFFRLSADGKKSKVQPVVCLYSQLLKKGYLKDSFSTERMALVFRHAFGIPGTARMFNSDNAEKAEEKYSSELDWFIPPYEEIIKDYKT